MKVAWLSRPRVVSTSSVVRDQTLFSCVRAMMNTSLVLTTQSRIVIRSARRLLLQPRTSRWGAEYSSEPWGNTLAVFPGRVGSPRGEASELRFFLPCKDYWRPRKCRPRTCIRIKRGHSHCGWNSSPQRSRFSQNFLPDWSTPCHCPWLARIK